MMKNLYKRIGLPTQTDNADEIKNAIKNCRASFEDKEAAQYILLDIQKKTVYDRNYNLLKTLGKVRADIGLNRTPLWLSVGCHDFDCEPSVPAHNVQPKKKPSFVVAFFSGLWGLVLFIFVRLLGLGLIFGILFLIGFFIDSFENNPKAKSYDRPPSSYSFEIPKSPKQYTPQKLVVEFNEPILPLPSNGFINRFHSTEAIAPLEIKTRYGTGNYYVKLNDYYTKKLILTIFVREGQSVNIDVPLGTYELKYAVGKNWYGNNFLFGPGTACCKADKRFEFVREGNQVTGFTVELYLQADGNLETDTIPVSSF